MSYNRENKWLELAEEYSEAEKENDIDRMDELASELAELIDEPGFDKDYVHRVQELGFDHNLFRPRWV